MWSLGQVDGAGSALAQGVSAQHPAPTHSPKGHHRRLRKDAKQIRRGISLGPLTREGLEGDGVQHGGRDSPPPGPASPMASLKLGSVFCIPKAKGPCLPLIKMHVL